MQKNEAILITGATGLVGSHLCQLLISQGYTNLYATRRSQSDLSLIDAKTEKQLQWRNMELDDYFSVEAALEGINTVIHCAALVSFQPADRHQLLQLNRVGTRHVANAALHQRVKRLVYMSSVAALGRNTNGAPIRETSKWEDGADITNYARSKFLSELEVWRAQSEGLSVAVLYPSIILGVGNWQRGSAKMVSFANSAPTYYPAGQTGIVDVRDVAKAVELTLERNINGDRFLLNGSNISYQDLLTRLCKALGKTPPQKLLSRRFAFILTFLDKWSALLRGRRPLLSKESVRNAYHHFNYDNQKSVTVLGLEYTPLDDTVKWIATAFLDQQAKI
ncbi:MAG: NAD-dependent epimerase/dehydratase family protein [Bacteroidota bacterium]